MTQKDIELLLKDLSARLTYGVICIDSRHGDSKITEIDVMSKTVYCDDFDEYAKIENVKPYLRPMSSMTEEERRDFPFPYYFEWIDSNFSLLCSNDEVCASIGFDEMYEIMDWLNSHHFDYRGLIEKDLALEAPEGMYEKKKE